MENLMMFNTPAANFEEALPIGNGHMGAMVYGKPDREKISFNHDTLWSGAEGNRPVPENAPEMYKQIQKLVLEEKHFDARVLSKEFTSYDTSSYLPFGNLFINFGDEDVASYSRFLDLETGVAHTDYDSDGYKHHREIFASYDYSLIALKISTECKKSFDFEFEHKLKITYSDENGTYKGICPYYVVNFETGNNGYEYLKEDEVVAFTHKITCTTDGNFYFKSNKFYVEDATETVIFISIDTTYDHNDRNVVLNYDVIKKAHIKDFSSLYNRASISLLSKEDTRPLDERIKEFDGDDLGLCELLFNFGRYLIISSSRKGSEAANLQGIWNEELIAPWRSNYTVNINTEMNYWPVHMANLSECFDPFISLMKKMQKTGRKTAKDYYNAKGFVCHHNIDFFGHTNPVGRGNSGSFIFSFWNMSSGWMASQLFDEYEYTLDKEKLKNVIFPIMKESADFYLDIMYEENGKLMICPSTSPENMFLVDGEGCAAAKTTMMTASILYDLFTKLSKACKILGIENNYEEVKENLFFPEILKDGRLPEWSEDLPERDPEHRHVSHLYGLHPADIITTDDTPKLADACRKSLDTRGDVGTGWSLAWKVNLWARLKDGNRALKILERQLKYVEPSAEIDYVNGGGTYPNLFDAHPPFQIDGNFGTLSGIIEMLMYSKTGYIEILPALPDKFKCGFVKGIKAKGNITVDISWKNNKATEVTLFSPVSQTVTIKINCMEKFVSLVSNETLTISIDK